jgi:hypothetical protein
MNKNLLKITKDECKDMFEDILKVLTYIFVLHILYVVLENSLFMNEYVLKMMLYSVIAIFIYHVIIKKIFLVHI